MVGLDYVINLVDKSFGSGIKKAKQNTKGLDDAVKKTDKDVRNLKHSGKAGFGGIIKWAKRAAIATGLVFGIQQVAAFGNELTNVTAKYEGYNNAIKFASGKEANQNFTFLNKTIKDMNLDMDAAYSGFQTLSGALKGTSLEGQGLRDVFEGVSMAGSVMNLTSEQMKGALLAVSQMASKGKVQAEEIRGQLGERIPGALAIASRAMGVSQQSFNKMLDDGKIYAEDFLPKFAKELKNTFVDGMPAAANSMQAAINRKNNAIISFKRAFGDVLRPAITGLLNVGTQFFNFLKELFNYLDPVKKAFHGVYEALEPLRMAFARNIDANKQFMGSMSAAEALMTGFAKVIEFVTPAIGFIADVLGFLEDSFREVRMAIMEGSSELLNSADFAIVAAGAMDGLKAVFELLKPVINAVAGVMGQLIKQFFKGAKFTLRVIAHFTELVRKSEFVQRSFSALKANITKTFEGIRDAAKNILGGVGDVLEGVFTLNPAKIKAGFKQAFSGVKEGVKAPIDGMIAGQIAYHKKLTKSNESLASATGKTATVPKSVNNKFGTTGSYGSGGAKAESSKVSGQVASGSSVRNVTFKIESLVKELKIQPQTLQQGAQEVERTVKDMFLRLIRDVELQTQ